MAPSVVAIGKAAIDINGFQKWAMGNLVDNLTRATYAEWLVGQALDVIGPDDMRMEWDAADFWYRGHPIEVKAGGRGQRWQQTKPSTVRYDIAQRREAWNASTNEWEAHDKPLRNADVYVFCLHTPVQATNGNVADPACWEFRVVATTALNKELRSQKTVGLGTLDRLTSPIGWVGVRQAVDAALKARGQATGG